MLRYELPDIRHFDTNYALGLTSWLERSGAPARSSVRQQTASWLGISDSATLMGGMNIWTLMNW